MVYRSHQLKLISTTDIEVSPQFYGWVCGLGKAARIVAPAEIVEEMGNYVKGIAEMY